MMHIPLRLLSAGVTMVAALGAAVSLARAETLKYEVQLFGVEVGEITAKIEGSRIRMEGETSGALVLFFPAKEEVVIETKGGRPAQITRTFDHRGNKGVWKLTFADGRVELERNDEKVKGTQIFKVKEIAYDPATALQKLRAAAPAKTISLLVFGVDAIYRFTAKRVSTKPLHYRGTFKKVVQVRKRKKKRAKMPPWLIALGLGKGATKRPELNVWLSNDGRKLPTRIRMSDRIGSLELVLTEPAVTTAEADAK